jgi:hypothetical protein
VFKQLTGLGRAGRLRHVWQSPFTLHKRVLEAIRNEARLAQRPFSFARHAPCMACPWMSDLLRRQVNQGISGGSPGGSRVAFATCSRVAAQDEGSTDVGRDE